MAKHGDTFFQTETYTQIERQIIKRTKENLRSS